MKNDPQNVWGSIEALPDQCIDAFAAASAVTIPAAYKDATAVVFSGMGGSGLGARVIESVFAGTMDIPLIRVNGYDLPGFVNEHTLVFCSSYSGTTEETLQTLAQAHERKAMVIAIASGGTLHEEAVRLCLPAYRIVPAHNPSDQPRMAIGYSLIGQLTLAARAGVIPFTKADVDTAVATMRTVQERCRGEDGPAHELAMLAHKKIILFLAAEHLAGPLHTVNNQCNENAKALTADFSIPEMNHHLLEGLVHPEDNSAHVLFVFIDSTQYSARNRERLAITKDLVEQKGISTFTYTCKGPDALAQAMELIQFGAYANFFLAMRYAQDPAPIPTVDEFKIRLGQPLGK